MKRTLSALLIAALALASLTACGKESGSTKDKTPKSTSENAATDQSVTDEPLTADSASGESVAEQLISNPIVDRQIIDRTNTDVITLLNTYKSILKNESTFFYTYSNADNYISQLTSISSENGTSIGPKEFAVIDLDYDNLPEVVLAFKRSPSDYDSVIYFVILHYLDDKVYGYSLPYRGFATLKTDGTFHWAGGAPHHGLGTITFTKKETLTDDYTYCDIDGYDASYVVNHQPATADIFDKALDCQDNKPSVTWHEYSKENIEKYFS